MHDVLILLDQLSDWKPYYETNSLITHADYLQNSVQAKQPSLVINLSNDLSYNSESYYSSLLAQARGHKILPTAATLNKLIAQDGFRIDKSLQKVGLSYAAKNNLVDHIFTVDIFFGVCAEIGLEKVARNIFDHYSCPLLQVDFKVNHRFQVDSIRTLSFNQLTAVQEDLFANALDHFSKKIWRLPRSKKPARYDLAIFHNPQEQFPPSNKRALNKFVELAKKMNINAELITEEDSTRLMEFDALFIRQTTALNHITFQLAQKAKQADMVVIDDPLSIIRCTNKVYLTELLEKEGIPTPASQLIFKHQKATFQQVSDRLGLPFIIKIPDGSFSVGMKKIENKETYETICLSYFEHSAILLAQEYLPTEYDWRIGILNGEPLYACKYYMVKGHWQIYYHQQSGSSKSGMSETVPVHLVPKTVLKSASKAASLVGKGFYGVDVKMINDVGVIIEINDNPSIDAGVEDAILGDELYYSILREFVRNLEQKRQ